MNRHILASKNIIICSNKTVKKKEFSFVLIDKTHNDLSS